MKQNPDRPNVNDAVPTIVEQGLSSATTKELMDELGRRTETCILIYEQVAPKTRKRMQGFVYRCTAHTHALGLLQVVAPRACGIIHKCADADEPIDGFGYSTGDDDDET